MPCIFNTSNLWLPEDTKRVHSIVNSGVAAIRERLNVLKKQKTWEASSMLSFQIINFRVHAELNLIEKLIEEMYK
jgi:hypothetical protein